MESKDEYRRIIANLVDQGAQRHAERLDLYVSDYAGNLYNFDISSVLKIKHNPQGVSMMRNRFEK